MSTLPTACATAKFVQQFHSITENEPYPWQVALFQSFMNGQLPASCDIPTGLGKTKIILIWWLARLAGGPVNRRLAYVVNRRTIVDQATTEAEAIAEKFPELVIATPF